MHGSVVGSDMDNAGDNEVIVKGNIENSNVANYGGKGILLNRQLIQNSLENLKQYRN